MKLFYRRISILLISFFVILCLLDFAISTKLQNVSTRMLIGWNRILSDTLDYDVLIVGSSETRVGFNPKILGDSLGLSVYNLSMNGCNFDRIIAQYDLYQEHYGVPKIMVINVGFNFLNTSGSFERQQYFPYIYNSTFRESILNDIPLNWAEKNIPFYRYFGYTDMIQEGLGIKHIKIKEFSIDGYFAQHLKYKNDYPLNYIFTYSSEAVVVSQFRNFLTNKQQLGCKIILVYAPIYLNTYNHIINKDVMLSSYQDLAKEYSIPFLNYIHDELSNDKSNFYNNFHLNAKGSFLFSQKLANDLKNSIIIVRE